MPDSFTPQSQKKKSETYHLWNMFTLCVSESGILRFWFASFSSNISFFSSNFVEKCWLIIITIQTSVAGILHAVHEGHYFCSLFAGRSNCSVLLKCYQEGPQWCYWVHGMLREKGQRKKRLPNELRIRAGVSYLDKFTGVKSRWRLLRRKRMQSR